MMIAGVFSVPPWPLSYIGACVWGSFLSMPQLTSSALYNFRILGRTWFSVSSLQAGGFCLLSIQGTGWACCHYLVSKSCPSLYDPMQYSLPGSSVHGIFQARILEWVAISISTEDARIWDDDIQTKTIVCCSTNGEIIEIGCNCIRQNFMNHYYLFQTEPWKHYVVFFVEYFSTFSYLRYFSTSFI